MVLSHHHPDHTVNIALFQHALVHDFQTTYVDDVWTNHKPGDFAVSDSVRLMSTPGHTDQDAPSHEVLRESRLAVIGLAPALVIPGHGAPFQLTDSVPR